MRRHLILLALLAGIAACAPPPDRVECAQPPTEGQTDGGIGGTGKAPETCPPD